MAPLQSATRGVGPALRLLSAVALPAMASCFITSGPMIAGVRRFSFSSANVAPLSVGSAARGSGFPKLRMMSSAPEGEDTVVTGMQKKITDSLKAVKCEVIPAYGDPNGSHVMIEVVSPEFEGKRSVQRQQMVYKVIWEEMQGAIHAVDKMVTKTPAEAGL